MVNIQDSLSCTEIMRVLKPGGLYLFVEHVAAEGNSSISMDANEL